MRSDFKNTFPLVIIGKPYSNTISLKNRRYTIYIRQKQS